MRAPTPHPRGRASPMGKPRWRGGWRGGWRVAGPCGLGRIRGPPEGPRRREPGGRCSSPMTTGVGWGAGTRPRPQGPGTLHWAPGAPLGGGRGVSPLTLGAASLGAGCGPRGGGKWGDAGQDPGAETREVGKDRRPDKTPGEGPRDPGPRAAAAGGETEARRAGAGLSMAPLGVAVAGTPALGTRGAELGSRGPRGEGRDPDVGGVSAEEAPGCGGAPRSPDPGRTTPVRVRPRSRDRGCAGRRGRGSLTIRGSWRRRRPARSLPVGSAPPPVPRWWPLRPRSPARGAQAQTLPTRASREASREL